MTSSRSNFKPNFSPGFVYVMESAGLYKIGYSASPRKRLGDVKVGSAAPVTLIGVIEGTRDNELEWQHHFRAKRSHGEWFALDWTDVELILQESYGIHHLG